MTLYTVTTKQLTLAVVLMSILTASLIGINNYVNQYLLLPEVHVSKADEKCVKVVNFENGHAFTCNDVDVLLRRYRKVQIQAATNE
jgi:hypothetical protein